MATLNLPTINYIHNLINTFINNKIFMSLQEFCSLNMISLRLKDNVNTE